MSYRSGSYFGLTENAGMGNDGRVLPKAQTIIMLFLVHCVQKNKSVRKLLRKVANRQTDKQRQKHILLGGGNKKHQRKTVLASGLLIIERRAAPYPLCSTRLRHHLSFTFLRNLPHLKVFCLSLSFIILNMLEYCNSS